MYMSIDFPIIDPLVKLVGEWAAEINLWSVIIRLVMAMVFSGLIGVERAAKHQAAGFRTYILVCLGASMVMMTNQFIFEQFQTGDAARLGAQVISGIGFLGAGTILITSRNQIKGLTTAAGLWASACMGLAIGIGFYTLAIVGCVLLVLVFTVLPKFENRFTSRAKNIALHVELEARSNLKDLVMYMREESIQIMEIEHNSAYASSGLSVYTIYCILPKKHGKYKKHDDVIEEIRKKEYVSFVEEFF